jgi:hypothetical protein
VGVRVSLEARFERTHVLPRIVTDHMVRRCLPTVFPSSSGTENGWWRSSGSAPLAPSQLVDNCRMLVLSHANQSIERCRSLATIRGLFNESSVPNSSSVGRNMMKTSMLRTLRPNGAKRFPMA